MNKLYKTLVSLFVLTLVVCNTGHANEGEKLNHNLPTLPLVSVLENIPMDALQLNQQVRIGDYQMQITGLLDFAGDDATGKGRIYVPFLEDSIDVHFDHIAVNLLGELISGEVYALVTNQDRPTHRTPEIKVLEYLKIAEDPASLPLLLNPRLETRGIDFGDYEMILTNMIFTQENTFFDATFMVHNPDGHVNTFSQKNIPLTDGDISFCDLQLPIDEGDVPYNDPEFPFTIKKFNEGLDGVAAGTYVAFGCEGLVSFQLVGEYEFILDPDPLVPNVLLHELYDGKTGDNLIATFYASMETWGQFHAGVEFNGSFEIDGVDGVVIYMTEGAIDYDDNWNPDYLDTEPNTWRGLYIDTISVKLPENLSIQDDQPIQLNAYHLVYQRATGISVTLSAQGTGTNGEIVAGALNGWGISVKVVSLVVEENSLTEFDLIGDIHIPVTGEGSEIEYNALFEKNTVTDKLEAQFTLDISGEYSLPFLEDSDLILEGTSVVGISAIPNSEGITSYKPHANLTGSINVKVDDFEFEALGFQDFNIPAEGGIEEMSIYAFSFAGNTFVTGEATSPSGSSGTNTPAPAPKGEKLKGFPISISDISFGTDPLNAEQKRLGFTLKVNFTNPKIGLNAEGGFAVYGKVDADQLNPMDNDPFEPWKAFTYVDAEVTKLLVDMDMGGITLAGGVISYDSLEGYEEYGKGFKGALEMSVASIITVQALAQFGTTDHGNNNVDYRYWFVDAKLLLSTGLPVVPGVIGIYGFGGGAYYNMTQASLPEEMDVEGASPPNPDTDNLGDLLIPGVSLSGTVYVPSKPPTGNIIGVKATVVLGTLPSASTANMDLTLEVSFNTDPDCDGPT